MDYLKISYWVVEIVAIVGFLYGCRLSFAKAFARGLEFFMIFIYGLILEKLDMMYFGTYHYSEDFLLQIMGVPICIALLWALILHGAMEISDALRLPMMAKPFLDAILAVWLDLALDAIAIRMGYWQWTIDLTDGWFGVPAGNLYAWMWVAFFYSCAARWIRSKVMQRVQWQWAYLLAPFVSYIGLFAAMIGVGYLGEVFRLEEQQERLWLFFFQFVVFLFVVRMNWRYCQLPTLTVQPFWWGIRYSIHSYFILAGFLLQIFKKNPWIGLVAGVTLFVEIFFHRQLVVRRLSRPAGE